MILRDMTSVYTIGSGLCSIRSHNSSLFGRSPRACGTRSDTAAPELKVRERLIKQVLTNVPRDAKDSSRVPIPSTVRNRRN
jgi:hypothetical protein